MNAASTLGGPIPTVGRREIFVTGGTGYIGRALISTLSVILERGGLFGRLT